VAQPWFGGRGHGGSGERKSPNGALAPAGWFGGIASRKLIANHSCIEISAHFGTESVENLVADRRNRFINIIIIILYYILLLYGETDNYLCQMLRCWFVCLSVFLWIGLILFFYLLRLFNFCFLNLFIYVVLGYHKRWWNNVVYIRWTSGKLINEFSYREDAVSYTLVFIADRVSDRSCPCFRRVYPNLAAWLWGHLCSYLNPRLAVSWLAVQWQQCEQQGRWHVVNFRPMSHTRFCRAIKSHQRATVSYDTIRYERLF